MSPSVHHPDNSTGTPDSYPDRAEGSGGRTAVRFRSGGTECAAWHYPGRNGGCVIMAGGYAVTKEPGTDQFAARFQQAGYSVLAFDYRGIGESGGSPRQVLRVRESLADWQAAVRYAAGLPEVDPARIALWAFSVSGGHVLRVAARTPQVAAVIAQTPSVGGPAANRHVLRTQRPLALARFVGRGLLDLLGAPFGRPPRLVDLAGRPGQVALVTSPDMLDVGPALNPGNRYPDWLPQVAARSALAIGLYRPGRDAARIRCPLLVLTGDRDGAAHPASAEAVARRAPYGELARFSGGHYAPFLAAHEEVLAVELAFLDRHLTAPEG